MTLECSSPLRSDEGRLGRPAILGKSRASWVGLQRRERARSGAGRGGDGSAATVWETVVIGDGCGWKRFLVGNGLGWKW
eukprot:297062-Prymnesium_polylepis.1